MSKTTRAFLAAALLVATAACTTSKTPIPELTGPSELALRIALSLGADTVLADGGSQTVLNIEATGPDGRPVRGLTLRVDQVVNGEAYDFGTLSAKTVVTGDDGRARVIFTAPRLTSEQVVTFFVVPIGSDFRGEVFRSIDLRLVPPGVIGPRNDSPVARFTFSPAAPNVLDTVIFDASTSGDREDGDPCGVRCTYRWEFGDGASSTGVFVSHQFRSTGTFVVRLTVTDSSGLSTQTAQSVTVGQGAGPTGQFTFSPTQPAINETVFFNASAIQPAAGRRIVSYEWNFGNGRTGTGVTTTTSYSTVGSFQVTLTVTDDAGARSTIGPVTVTTTATGSLTATLTVSPGAGSTATTFSFDGSASRPGANPIVEYRFNFGDATPEVAGTSPSTTHRYTAPGSYVARLTIRDSAGRTATTTQTVTVN